MVEASQIDDYGHANQLDPLVEEILDFDRTIGKVFEWAAADGETLVVVTADHETGGLTLVGGSLPEGEIIGKFLPEIIVESWSPCMHLGPERNCLQVFMRTRIFLKKSSIY